MAKKKETETTTLAPPPTAELCVVLIDKIAADPNQPRKYYDDQAMNDLIASIRANGILQPILVRPDTHNYKIVCGERRYRAAKAVGLLEIPAVIMDLNDDQALEMQIVENLQRIDVQPMEEAVAFKSLRDRFSIEEIAARVGKSGHYVAQRIKLNDLIPVFQELLFHGKITLVKANQLCRFPEKTQAEVANELRLPAGWQSKKDFAIDHWKLNGFDDHEHDLSKAPFKANDTELYPEAGACNVCPHNSAANKLLFEDLNKKRICHNSVCYEIKCSRDYQRTIKEALEDPEMIFVSLSSYPSKDEKAKIKAAEEAGAYIISEEDIEFNNKPEPVDTWQDWLESSDDWSDDDDISAADKNKSEADCREDWNDAVKEYEQELAEYEATLKNGKLRKAFVVVGSWKAKAGEIIHVKLRPKKGAKLSSDKEVPENVAQLQLESEINGIEDRRARNIELDREKVYKQVVDLFKSERNDFTTAGDELSPDEWAAFTLVMAESSYDVRKYFAETLKVSDSYDLYDVYQGIYKNEDVTILYRAMRLFFKEKLMNLNECDYGKRGKPAAMFAVAKQYWPKEVAQFELEQQEKAEKRDANAEKKIAALKKKMDLVTE